MEELCQTVANRGMDSVAVTDHGHLHGMLDFYQSAQKTGIKPIMGSEVYILPEGCSATERKREDLCSGVNRHVCTTQSSGTVPNGTFNIHAWNISNAENICSLWGYQ